MEVFMLLGNIFMLLGNFMDAKNGKDSEVLW